MLSDPAEEINLRKAPLARNTPQSDSRVKPPERSIRQKKMIPLGIIPLLLALLALSCGTRGHAILILEAPATVVSGVPFSATVTAMYEGKRDTVIDGPIHFTTTDKAVILPTLYQFTPADAGQHTFNNLLLLTPGMQTVTVSDYDATPIAGSVNIMVTTTP
jgi:hypothetical protein